MNKILNLFFKIICYGFCLYLGTYLLFVIGKYYVMIGYALDLALIIRDDSGSEEVPIINSSSEEVPLNSSSEEVPLNSSSEEVPLNSSSEEVPLNSSSEEVPIINNLSVEVVKKRKL